MFAKRVEVVERKWRDSLPFTCCPVNREYSWKKIRKKKTKKKKKATYTLQHVRTDSHACGWKASWIFHEGNPCYTEPRTLICSANSFWFVSIQQERHEWVTALLLACIHWNIFLDYDKVTEIYALKYQRTMLLINLLSKN